MIRERLTITLREDILKTVDRAIDGTKIRNRSHAIEYLIQKASSPAITHALILAGGKGAKPGPLSKEMPKAMLPVGGKPALEHTLLLCKQHGLHNIIISMGPEGAEIEKYFGDGSRFDLSITYLKQARSEVGTAPAMKQAEALLKNEPFVLMYGDVVADINVTDLIEFHLGMNTLGTMALTSVDRAHDWGVVLLHGTKITAFIEKPTADAHSHVINAGLFCFQPQVFSLISSTDTKLEHDLFPKLAQAGMLSGYLFDGRWYDVGNSKIYSELLKSQPKK